MNCDLVKINIFKNTHYKIQVFKFNFVFFSLQLFPCSTPDEIISSFFIIAYYIYSTVLVLHCITVTLCILCHAILEDP